MKKEYVKPTLLVLTTEPSQIMVGSPGSEGGGMGGVIEGEDGEDSGLGGNIPDDDGGNVDEGGSLSKGGLWDEYTW